MPVVKTKDAGRSKGGERKRNGSTAKAEAPRRNGVPVAAGKVESRDRIPGLPQVRGRMTLGDGTPCVIISEKDYEQVFCILEERELVDMLADPRTEWVSLEEADARLAAKQLAAARKARGMTQVQLARCVGLPQSQISRIERNPDHTTVRTMKKIAAALNLNVGDLLG